VRPEVRRGGVQQVPGTPHELPDGLWIVLRRSHIAVTILLWLQN